MTLGSAIPDKTLLKLVIQKLARNGTGHITPTIRGGDVTLTGTLRYEHQRRSILKCASGISGVRRVIDQMIVELKKKGWA